MIEKLASFDYDGCLVPGKFSMNLVSKLSQKPESGQEAFIEPFYFDEAKKLYSTYLDNPLPEYYKEYSVSIIELIGRGLKGKRPAEVKKFTKNYVEKSRPLWMAYTQDIIDLFNYYDYTKAAITGMPGELAFPLSEKFGINKSRVYASSYEVKKGVYTGETKNVYSLNNSKEKKLQELHKRLSDESLWEKTVVVEDNQEGPFMSAGWGILLNFTGELTDESLLEKFDNGKLLVCGPKDNVVHKTKQFLRKIEKELAETAI